MISVIPGDYEFDVQRMYAAGREWLEAHDASPRFHRVEDFGDLLYESNQDAVGLRRAILAACPYATGQMLSTVALRLLGEAPRRRSGLLSVPMEAVAI